MEIKIVNVVATLNLSNQINLDELSKIPTISYNPEKYRCAYFKDEKMEAKVSIFHTGKMIAVGARSEKSAKHDLQHVFHSLVKLRLIKESSFKIQIQNVVAIIMFFLVLKTLY